MKTLLGVCKFNSLTLTETLTIIKLTTSGATRDNDDDD